MGLISKTDKELIQLNSKKRNPKESNLKTGGGKKKQKIGRGIE